MRLLETLPNGEIRLTRKLRDDALPPYAILSHTWGDEAEEVTYEDMIEGSGQSKAGYEKIKFCSTQASIYELRYFWVDSCCINKSSDAELSESLNSMFRWYRRAVKCFVYLSDVYVNEDRGDEVSNETSQYAWKQDFRKSRWFTRGWTLQELLAPTSVIFFSRESVRLGDKKSLEQEIHEVTEIPLRALRGSQLSQFSTEQKFVWTKNRQTTREEDQAYCLLGIFDVYLPLIYGEGREHALHRLRTEIFSRHARDPPKITDASVAEKHDACLSNLVATDQSQFLLHALGHSKHGCTWFLKHEKYISWHESDESSLLWLTAKPGCGKTTTAAHICQMIPKQRISEPIVSEQDSSKDVVLYFFFQNSNDEAVNTAPVALRTIASQLVRQVPAVFSILFNRHEALSTNGDFEWSWENISVVLGEMLQQTPLTYVTHVIFDAIDECEAKSRILLLDWIKGLADNNAIPTRVHNSTAALKILATSRPDGDMFDHFSSFPTLEIAETDTKKDIEALIHSRMEELARQRRLKPEVTRRIIQFLETNAHGMFLWVTLILKELERRDVRLSDEAIASKLSSIPLTLIDTYEAILQNVPSTRKQDMWRIIRWLLVSSRSLTLAELATGLCLETGISSWHDFAGDLTFLCGSLIRFGGPHEEINFVHQTARDFLEAFSAKLSSGDNNAANEHFAAICLQYLLSDDISLGLHGLMSQARTYSVYVDMMQGLLDQYLFLRYAVESWAFHARAIRSPSSMISDIIRGRLSSLARRDNIMTLTYFINKQMSWNVPHGHTPLHLAVYFNIPWLAQMYILDDENSVHVASDMNDTPLIWASEMGSTECVKILLDAGADPNTFEADGWSALHWAARNGHLDIANMLCQHGARLGQRDRNNHTPLHWAIVREHRDISDFLRRWADRNGLRNVGRLQQILNLGE